MQIERYYLGCLAHASYIIHDNGEAAVIDPRRDVDLYVDEARERGLNIRWVIETHLHADFVSGHLELARRTGAGICLGAGSGAAFEHRELRDGDELTLGSGSLKILSTPGHTEESICIVASEHGEPVAVFTGDTLFIGDVGRPDLSDVRTPRELASLLFDSLHQKVLALPDTTTVYPAHGAGSLCGRQMSGEPSSTIGRERRENYALQPMSREQFIELLTSHMPSRPAYFRDEVERNRSGVSAVGELEEIRELTPAEVLAMRESGAAILDTRPAEQFAAGHVPGAVHVALSGQFASWAARLLGIDGPLVLIAENAEALRESRLRLARVGREEVTGALDMARWMEEGRPLQGLKQASARELASWLQKELNSRTVLDVREVSERTGGSIPDSVCIPLPELQWRMGEIDPDTTVIVHCKGGYRSSVAASLLQAGGFQNVINLSGGYDAWERAATEAASASASSAG